MAFWRASRRVPASKHRGRISLPREVYTDGLARRHAAGVSSGRFGSSGRSSWGRRTRFGRRCPPRSRLSRPAASSPRPSVVRRSTPPQCGRAFPDRRGEVAGGEVDSGGHILEGDGFGIVSLHVSEHLASVGSFLARMPSTTSSAKRATSIIRGEVRPGGLVGNSHVAGQRISLNSSSYVTQGPPLGDNSLTRSRSYCLHSSLRVLPKVRGVSTCLCPRLTEFTR
jgi:hypothetical protein